MKKIVKRPPRALAVETRNILRCRPVRYGEKGLGVMGNYTPSQRGVQAASQELLIEREMFHVRVSSRKAADMTDLQGSLGNGRKRSKESGRRGK